MHRGRFDLAGDSLAFVIAVGFAPDFVPQPWKEENNKTDYKTHYERRHSLIIVGCLNYKEAA